LQQVYLLTIQPGDPEKAVEDFDLALKQNGDDPDIYYHRAQLHFIKGEYNEAQKDYQKSIDLDRDFIFSHIQLGVTQYKMGSIASSTATFRRCIKNFTSVPDVYNYYGELLLDQGHHQEAIEKFDMAIQLEKDTRPLAMNVLPLINKALALFQWKNDLPGAEHLCETALLSMYPSPVSLPSFPLREEGRNLRSLTSATVDPECDIAVATMAQLLLQEGKLTNAIEYFERAAQLARTEGEMVSAMSYAEATRTQVEVQEKHPKLAAKLNVMNPALR
jgi:mitochondrial import receptor subunit TOM70